MWRPGHLDEEPIGTGPRSNGRAGATRTTALALTLAALACDAADTPPSVPGLSAADSIVAEWVEAEIVPGAVLLVARDGDVVFERAYGWAQLHSYGEGQYRRADGIERLAEPVPMSPATAFDLASVTKAMATTMAVMLLSDRGELAVDAPVSTYLPDFIGGGKEDVTIRHLLTHTAGLRQWEPTYYHASSADEAYAFVRDLPLAWPVGEERHYSDLGFMLLGRIVDRVTGRGLHEYLEEELYGPLGLERTSFRPAPDGASATPAAGPDGFAATSHGNPYERRMVHDREFGYRIEGDPERWSAWRERTLIGEVNDGNAYHAFRGVAGHAGLFSTARDLAALLDLLLAGGVDDDRRHVGAETVERFVSPALEGQALGWQLPDYAPPGSFGHAGFTGTFVLAVPSERLAIVLLTNRQNAGVDSETRYSDVGPLQRAVTGAIAGRREVSVSTRGRQR